MPKGIVVLNTKAQPRAKSMCGPGCPAPLGAWHGWRHRFYLQTNRGAMDAEGEHDSAASEVDDHDDEHGNDN